MTIKAKLKLMTIKAKLKRENRRILMICKQVIRGKELNEKQKATLNKYFKRMFLFTVDNEKMLKTFVYCKCRDAGMKLECEKFLTTL